MIPSRVRLCANQVHINAETYADNVDVRVSQDIEDAIVRLFRAQLQAEAINKGHNELLQIAARDFDGDLTRAYLSMNVQHEKRRGQASLEAKVNYERDRVLGEFSNSMSQTAIKYRDRLTGQAELPHDVELNIYRELDGASTGDPLAKELAGNFERLADELKWTANYYGARIKTLKDWLMPQRHRKDKMLGQAGRNALSPAAMRDDPSLWASARDSWVKNTKALLDRDRMRRRLNSSEVDGLLRARRPNATSAELKRMRAEVYGRSKARNPVLSMTERTDIQNAYEHGVPMIDTELDELLGKIFKTIIFDGEEIVDLQVPGKHGGKLADVNSDHRVLHFKDAEASFKYAKMYGESNTLQTMFDHLQAMAEGTVLLKEGGPDPMRTHRTLMRFIEKSMKDDNRKGKHSVNFLDSTYNLIAGDIGEKSKYADALANARSVINWANLGSSLFAAVGDPAYGMFNTFMNGGSISRYWVNRIAQMVPFMARMSRAEARENALIVEHAAAAMRTFVRFGEVEGSRKMQNISNAFYNINLLAPFQKGSEAAFRQTMLSNINSIAKKLNTQRGPNKRQLAFMERYGISADDIRSLPVVDGRVTLRGATADARMKVGAAIREESVYGSMEQGARTRAATTGGTAGGDAKGEAFRFAWQWKSFIHSLMVSNGARMLEAVRGNTGVGGRAAGLTYTLSLMGTATLLTAIGIQLREVGKGRTPRSMESEEDVTKLMIEAFVASGAGGFAADYITSTGMRDRYGKGVGNFIVPPALRIASDDLISRSFFWTIDSEASMRENWERWKETYPDEIAMTAATRLVPFNSLPVYRVFWDRVILGDLLGQVFPEGREAMLEREARYMDEHRMEYLVEP